MVVGTPFTLATCSPAHLPAAPIGLVGLPSKMHKAEARSRPGASLLSLTSNGPSDDEATPHARIRHITRALTIRGGASTSSPELKTFAEAATIATAAAAAMTYFCPAAAASGLYGLPNKSPLVVWLIRALGGSLAMIAIQAYCVFYKGISYTQAVGFGCLPFMINEIRTLILNETRQWDMPPWGLLFISLPISSSCAYMLINMSDKAFAKNVVKAFAFWVLVGNGLPLGLAPETAATKWGISHEEDGVLESLKLIGFADIAAALFMMMLDKEVESTIAFVLSFALLSGLLIMECLQRRFA